MTTLTTLPLIAGIRCHHATLAKAMKLNDMLIAEYPAIRLMAMVDDADGEAKVTAWQVATINGDAIGDELAKVPALADVLDACEEEGIDPTETPEGEEDDEETKSGSVVSDVYRQLYRTASSNGQTCGDWLAEFLVANTHAMGTFNVHDFEGILNDNGVDMTAKWATVARNPGWVGRFRMNGRQVLEKIVARAGSIVAHGATVEAPADFVTKMRTKHANWIAKMEKAEAKAAAAEDEATRMDKEADAVTAATIQDKEDLLDV